MGKTDIVPGHASLKDFYYWINERHRIWMKRFELKRKKPWSDDPIFQKWKFTNVFRELDRGTIALRKMTEWAGPFNSPIPADLLLFNIVWYRLFNWIENASEVRFVEHPDILEERIRKRFVNGHRIFTNAHMTVGLAGELKHNTMVRTARAIFQDRQKLVEFCRYKSLKLIFEKLQDYIGIGRFIAYEMVSDFRWYGSLLYDAEDIMSWVNIGPGCDRGLRRLGFPSNIDSIKELHHKALEHFDIDTGLHAHYWIRDTPTEYPPFELREIEHSLCEFDKYQRAKTGVGTPRMKFNGI